MKLKHTPGPWGCIHEVEDKVWIRHKNGVICAIELHHNKPHDVLYANARLIAAAPKMLESLIHLIGEHFELYGSYTYECRKAKEVIEKATGLKYEEVSND